MKTLQVVRRFVFEEWGGTETVVWNTAQELGRLGNPPEILATSALERKGNERVEGINIRRFSYFYPYLNLSATKKVILDKKGGDPYSLALYRYLMRAQEIELIHCHTMNRLAGEVRLAAKQRKIPYLVSFHGGHFEVPAAEMAKMVQPYQGTFNYGRIIDLLIGKNKYLTDASGIICVGYNEYEAALTRYPDKPVYYLPNGVRVDRFNWTGRNDFREKYKISEQEKVILCVSRIDYQKNQLQLVELLRLLRQRGEQVKLVLIGPVTSTEYLAKIEKAISSYSLQKDVVLIKGLKADAADLIKAYRAADVFILPSVHEPFGIVVLEAWASGIPVIASAVGGLRKLLNPEVNALHFDGSDADLYHKYDLLAKNREFTSQLCRNAFTEVQAYYTWEVITARLLQFYREILKSYRQTK